MSVVVLVIALVLILLAVVVVGWSLLQWRTAAGQIGRLQGITERDSADLQRSREQLQRSGEEIESLRREGATLATDLALARETVRQQQASFDEALKQSRQRFSSIATDVLKASNEQFLALARKSFESEQKEASSQLEQRKQAVKALVDPIHEKLGQYGKHLPEIEKTRHDAYGALRQQVGSLILDQRRLREETANLVTALRRPEVRGRWGEIQLRRVVELAGMVEHCDFTEQVSVGSTEGSTRRPDMVVHLPAGRQIVVDSKAPMDAYLSAIDADSDEERESLFVQHAEQIEAQVRSLAAKQYGAQFESRVMTSARRFEEMGSASPKSLPESLDSVDTVPRKILDSGSG